MAGEGPESARERVAGRTKGAEAPGVTMCGAASAAEGELAPGVRTRALSWVVAATPHRPCALYTVSALIAWLVPIPSPRATAPVAAHCAQKALEEGRGPLSGAVLGQPSQDSHTPLARPYLALKFFALSMASLSLGLVALWLFGSAIDRHHVTF